MVIVETSVFTRQVTGLLADDEYRDLQEFLSSRPNAGVLISGGGGLRKLRWSLSGRGKRGGIRIIYYWAAAQERLLLLFAYPKGQQPDLTPAQIKILRGIIKDEYP